LIGSSDDPDKLKGIFRPLKIFVDSWTMGDDD
jgi:hypothetical protein